MFSFILNDFVNFTSNYQSYLLINKILSIYNSNLLEQNKEKDNNIKETIYSFLKSFFNNRILGLIKSNNYIYSIINLIIILGYPKNDFIYTEIENEFQNYAYNRQGCLLIQKIFPLGNKIQQQNLLNLIIQQYNSLIVDKFGHYLFKYLLYQAENGENYYQLILSKIIDDIKRYTNNKYSSVVIERLLDSSNVYIINIIIGKICQNENDVVELMNHSYGNYVLQKIIDVLTYYKGYNILEMIYKTVMKNKNVLCKLPYGKKIIKKIIAANTLK